MIGDRAVAPGSPQPADRAVELLRADGATDRHIRWFTHYRRRYTSGDSGYIPESSIAPLATPVAIDRLSETGAAPSQVASVKLNGGLGTSMGLNGPKCLLEVRPGQSFLSLVLRQHLNGLLGSRLILMNSFNSDADTRHAIPYDAPRVEFIQQGRVPRLQAHSLAPLEPDDWGDRAWAPPGHGELVGILREGLAQELLRSGIRYLFISNMDNLGATVDYRVPSYMAHKRLPWVTEVCARSERDIKGGHVAVAKHTRRLLVRDSNMVAPEDWLAYVDNKLHAYFNTNNLWVDLRALEALEADAELRLPLIANTKRVESPKGAADVLQLETGIGTALSLFDGAEAILSPRSRFIPVKDSSQLDLLRSDWFTVRDDGRLDEPDPSLRPAAGTI